MENQSENPLYGLVLIGGKSIRMKSDKASLVYHNKSQANYSYLLLRKVCSKVYLSKRKNQNPPPDCNGLHQINDLAKYEGVGPLGGILSAMEKHPYASWLVLACDLPFASEATIAYLVDHRDVLRSATTYLSAHDGFPEPLCTIYEKGSCLDLQRFLAAGVSCPREILRQLNCAFLTQQDKSSLDNINSRAEYDELMRRRSQGK